MDCEYSAKSCTVVFVGGEAPRPEEAEAFFSGIRCIGSVIAADSGLDTLEGYLSFFGNTGLDFSPNLIIGDMDSIRDKSLLKKFSDAKVEVFPGDKDFTDTELALMKAHDLAGDGESFIVLIGGNGGRADHFIGILDTFSFDYRADCWLCGSQAVFFLGQGKRLLARGLKKDGYVSIARTSSSFEGGSIVTDGLEWVPDAGKKKGMPSLSNRVHDEKKGLASFYAEEGDFLVFLPLTAAFALA
ncbi:MAG: hypothetical protein K6E22_13975 [Treponema sp.]|nr:hypothetical protein [Treponema sp.]